MTAKMIAIGILALLALSLVMRSRAVRMVFGFGALAVLILIVLSGLGGSGTGRGTDQRGLKEPSWLADLDLASVLRKGGEWQKMADSASQSIWKTFSKGKATSIDLVGEYAPQSNSERSAQASQRTKGFLVRRIPITVDPPPEADNMTAEMGQARLVAHMKLVIQEYLSGYQKLHPNDLGVSLLRPEQIDWRLIRWRHNIDANTGEARLTLVFDDRLHRHVRDRGQKVLTAQRLKSTASVAFAIFGVLSMGFGALKIVSLRRAEAAGNDLLLASGIKMM